MDISGEQQPVPYEENVPLYESVKGPTEIDISEISKLAKQIEDTLLGESTEGEKEITVQQWGETYDYGAPEIGLFNPNSFEESIKVYKNIKVSTASDENGQNYYHFSCPSQNGILSPYLNELIIISFDSFAGTLLNINNIVLPLHEFIHVSRMEEIVPQNEVCPNHQLRNEPALGYGVKCYSIWSHREFSLPNTSIPLIMRAISYFQSIERENSKVVDEYFVDTLRPEDYRDTEGVVEHSNSSPSNDGLLKRFFKIFW